MSDRERQLAENLLVLIEKVRDREKLTDIRAKLIREETGFNFSNNAVIGIYNGWLESDTDVMTALRYLKDHEDTIPDRLKSFFHQPHLLAQELPPPPVHHTLPGSSSQVPSFDSGMQSAEWGRTEYFTLVEVQKQMGETGSYTATSLGPCVRARLGIKNRHVLTNANIYTRFNYLCQRNLKLYTAPDKESKFHLLSCMARNVRSMEKPKTYGLVHFKELWDALRKKEADLPSFEDHATDVDLQNSLDTLARRFRAVNDAYNKLMTVDDYFMLLVAYNLCVVDGNFSMEALVKGMEIHTGEKLNQLNVERRFKAICSRSLRELTSEDRASRYSLLCLMLRTLKAGKTCEIEDFQKIWNALKAARPSLPDFGSIVANQKLQESLSEQVEAPARAAPRALAAPRARARAAPRADAPRAAPPRAAPPHAAAPRAAPPHAAAAMATGLVDEEEEIGGENLEEQGALIHRLDTTGSVEPISPPMTSDV